MIIRIREQCETSASEDVPFFTIAQVAGVPPPEALAPKYRDPKDPSNTWSGRGRMPNWLASALKNGKASKDDFLI